MAIFSLNVYLKKNKKNLPVIGGPLKTSAVWAISAIQCVFQGNPQKVSRISNMGNGTSSQEYTPMGCLMLNQTTSKLRNV